MKFRVAVGRIEISKTFAGCWINFILAVAQANGRHEGLARKRDKFHTRRSVGMMKF
nr:hypothetical protein [uncultured Campylobacter sp.]